MLPNATNAVERGDAWVQDFGDAPPAGGLYERWVLEVATGAAYLDRWGIGNAHTLLDDVPLSHEQETERGRVFSAAQRAYSLTLDETVSAKAVYVFSGDGTLEPPNQDFELDL